MALTDAQRRHLERGLSPAVSIPELEPHDRTPHGSRFKIAFPA